MYTVTAEIIQAIALPELPESRDGTTPIIEYHDRALPSCTADTDGDGVYWLGYHHLMGNASAYHLASEHPTTHVLTERALILPPPNTKIDAGHWRQNGTGPDGYVTMTVHEISSSPTRAVYVARAEVRGLFAPFRNDAPRGGIATFGPPPAPQPSDPGFTLDELIARLLTELRSTRADGMGKTMQAHAKNGATDALAAHGVTLPEFLQDPDALLAVLQNGMYQWAKDRAYEGANAAIHPEPPEATP